MPLKIEILKQAEAEAAEAHVWYARRSPASAARFLKAFDRAVEAIAGNPHRWPKGIRQTRRYRLSRFPFVVVYAFDDEHIRIFAIAHLKRRPNYWRKRL